MSSPSQDYFHPRRLGHVNLWVADLKRSERFYSECCGLTVEFSEPDLIATFLGTGQTPHDLGMIETTKGVDRYGRDGLLQLPGSIGVNVGLNHLAWELENERDLVEGFRRLKANGVETDITVDHQVAHSVYMFDPDGNYNEFYCDTVMNWQDVLQGEMELITSEWDPLGETDPFTEGRYDPAPDWHVVDAAPMHPRRVTHAVIQTGDVARLVDFYAMVGGLHVTSVEHGVHYLAGSHDAYDHHLVIVPGDASAYGHATFELENESAYDEARAALRQDGVAIDSEVSLPWKRSMFLIDPDGMASEWTVKLDGARDLAARDDVPLLRAV